MKTDFYNIIEKPAYIINNLIQYRLDYQDYRFNC